MKLGLNNEGQVLHTGPNKNEILFRWIMPVFQQHVRGCTCISQSKEMNKSMSFLLACSFSQAKQVYFCVQGTRERDAGVVGDHPKCYLPSRGWQI